MKVTFSLTKSLIIMEMRTRSENCIAIDPEFAASYEARGIDRRYNIEQNQTLSQINVEMKKLKPYFVQTADMDTMLFSQVPEKREIVQNIRCSVRMESVMEKLADGEFLIVNNMQVDLEKMLIRVSIDDLYLIQSIVSRSASESLAMTFAWLNYSNKKGDLDEEARKKSGVIIK